MANCQARVALRYRTISSLGIQKLLQVIRKRKCSFYPKLKKIWKRNTLYIFKSERRYSVGWYERNFDIHKRLGSAFDLGFDYHGIKEINSQKNLWISFCWQSWHNIQVYCFCHFWLWKIRKLTQHMLYSKYTVYNRVISIQSLILGEPQC